MKQQPVVTRLHDTLEQALAYVRAIADNATDDQQPIPSALVADIQKQTDSIIRSLLTVAL